MMRVAERWWDTERDRVRAVHLARTARDISVGEAASEPGDTKDIDRRLASRTSSH
ncbi:MAG: hypothetical protein AB7P03_04655 [Kofleriaceae bacterium]